MVKLKENSINRFVDGFINTFNLAQVNIKSTWKNYK
jgi:hypothetical protein